jgi:hypothetical protein
MHWCTYTFAISTCISNFLHIYNIDIQSYHICYDYPCSNPNPNRNMKTNQYNISLFSSLVLGSCGLARSHISTRVQWVFRPVWTFPCSGPLNNAAGYGPCPRGLPALFRPSADKDSRPPLFTPLEHFVQQLSGEAPLRGGLTAPLLPGAVRSPPASFMY